MVEHEIGRLSVVEHQRSDRLVDILTRSDILAAHRQRLEDSRRSDPIIDFPLSLF